MAAFSVFRLSCGEPLLSMPTTSNLTPAGFLRRKLLGDELPALELVLADVGERAGQRVDERDLDGLAFLGKCAGGGCGHEAGGHELECEFHRKGSPGERCFVGQNERTSFAVQTHEGMPGTPFLHDVAKATLPLSRNLPRAGLRLPPPNDRPHRLPLPEPQRCFSISCRSSCSSSRISWRTPTRTRRPDSRPSTSARSSPAAWSAPDVAPVLLATVVVCIATLVQIAALLAMRQEGPHPALGDLRRSSPCSAA